MAFLARDILSLWLSLMSSLLSLDCDEPDELFDEVVCTLRLPAGVNLSSYSLLKVHVKSVR